jgi:hypothetical protein
MPNAITSTKIKKSDINFSELQSYTSYEFSLIHTGIEELTLVFLFSGFLTIISVNPIRESFRGILPMLSITLYMLLLFVLIVAFFTLALVLNKYEYVITENRIIKFRKSIFEEPYVYGDIKSEDGKKCIHPAIRYDEIKSVREDSFGNKIVKSEYQVSDNWFVSNPTNITDSSVEENRYIKVKSEELRDNLEERLVSWKL